MLINGKEYKSERDYKRERDREVQAKISSTQSSSGSAGSHSSSLGGGSSERSSSASYTPSSSSSGTLASSTSYTRPSSGGSSYQPQYSGSVNRDYHQEAQDAAARGDWNAVTRALAARQEKINAQGGNDRGTSNAQILQNLQNLYRNSYNALSDTTRNNLSMAASGQFNGKGWEDGHDYLAEAQSYARAGDMEAAYDALRRRGFKMADTGSSGGGTSQDQAYALIQNLYDHSQGAASSYQSQLAENQRRLQEHPTIFGTGTNPNLANKHFTSADGKYIVYYDSNGTPFKSQPNNGQYGSSKYTPEYTGLMQQYYSGEGDVADIRRQLHNLDVVYSGNGRLLDQNWNWASGDALPVRDSYQYWADVDNDVYWNRNTGQDKNALAELLSKINQGQTFQSPAQVPLETRITSPYHDILTYDGEPITFRTWASAGGDIPTDGNPGRFNGLVSAGTGGKGLISAGTGGNGLVQGSVGDGGLISGYPGSDLTEYIRQMYQQSLAAQLAALQSSYDQNRAAMEAENARIAQEYQAQRNQAAGQSDLQRMYMAELGNYLGLNTGATGQLALAQSMALQNNLANLGTAENQDLSKNALALNQLQSAYLGDVNSAQAQSYSQIAGALYDEYVRQIQAAEAARAAAQAQANWQAQFDYQKQYDALAYELQRQQLAQAQANWQAQFDYQTQQDSLDRQYQQELMAYQQQAAAQEYAYNLQQAQLEAQLAAGKQNASNAWNYAQLLLKNGVMPDEATLYAAGLDATSAQSLADSYKWQLSQKYAPKTSGSSGRSSSGGTSSSKPRLTYSQALAAIENGQTSDAAIQAYDYYMGNGAYNQYFGDAGATGNGRAAGNISTYIQGINNALTNGNTMAADGYLRSIWPNLSNQEKQQMQSVLSRYGIQYNP